MKNKLALLLAFAALLQAATGEAQLATGVTLTNLQGKVYNNITIDHTNKLGVIWKGADGSMGQIKYNELAMEYWVKLNLSDSAQKYDEAIALQQEQEQKARLAQAEAARQAAKQQAELTASAQTNSAQRQMQLDAEAKQMAQAGMMEFTVQLFENFPEKAVNKHGWIDAYFQSLDNIWVESKEDELGFDIRDMNGDSFGKCHAIKTNPYNGNPDPVISEIIDLKRGDKVRFIGMGMPDVRHDDMNKFTGFYVSKIEMIESAADAAAIKKVKQELEN